ncbi:MAG: hypothetical protein GXP41_12750 [Chloroflexi bacterium]|nr:hypothetical protein [Chloroflexota bacterium]
MFSHKSKVVVWIGILFLATLLACRFGSTSRPATSPATPTPTLVPVVISQEAADRFQSKISQQVLNNESDQFSVTFTDEEVTSFAALNSTELPVSNPQIHFGNDKIFLSGKANVGITAQILLIATVRLNDGDVVIHVEEAKMGRLAMPDSLREQISTTINESIAEAGNMVQITYIQVSPGQITLRGTKTIPGK